MILTFGKYKGKDLDYVLEKTSSILIGLKRII